MAPAINFLIINNKKNNTHFSTRLIRLTFVYIEAETGARPASFLNRLVTPRSYKSDGTEKNTIDLPHPSVCSMETARDSHVREARLATADGKRDKSPKEEYKRRCGSPSSPDESFSEVTKQFYHKPSGKRGIFDRKKVKFGRTHTFGEVYGGKHEFAAAERKLYFKKNFYFKNFGW